MVIEEPRVGGSMLHKRKTSTGLLGLRTFQCATVDSNKKLQGLKNLGAFFVFKRRTCEACFSTYAFFYGFCLGSGKRTGQKSILRYREAWRTGQAKPITRLCRAAK